MKHNIKFISFFLSLFLVINYIATPAHKIYGYSNTANNYITEYDASLITKQFIYEESNLTNNMWDYTTSIKSTIKLYDFNDNVIMYLFRLTTNGIDKGYVLLDANSSNPYIYSFSYDSDYILDSISIEKTGINTKDDEKIIIYDDFSFLIKKEDEEGKTYYIDFETDEIIDISQNKNNDKPTKLKIGKSSSKTKIKDNAAKASSKTNNYVIAGILDKDYKIYTNKDFPKIKNYCGPIAGINLIYYWTHAHPLKNSLSPLWNKNTFSDLATYMNTTLRNSTTNHDLSNGLINYAKNKNKPIDFWDESNGKDWSFFKDNIDKNIPIITLLNKDPKYKNHFVVAIGYKYKNNNKYLRILDGWSKSTNIFYKYRGNIVDARYIKW